MPNPGNVTRPVTLLGLGRSGTTLMSKTFARHSQFQSCDETGGLIFGVWEGSKQTFMPLDVEDWHLADKPDEKAAFYVQKTLAATCPSDKPRWFHKPAGIPFTYMDFHKLPGARGPVTQIPVEWYWTVLRKTFPEATFMTILRNPFDVAVSRMQHTNWKPVDVLQSAAKYMEIFLYGRDHFDLVLSFEELTDDYEASIRRACLAAGCDFEPGMLTAKTKNHAAVEGRAPKSHHRDDWSVFADLEIPQSYIALFEEVWDVLGRPFEAPSTMQLSR
ncbi:MAG: sulfotransferase [Pseudomonadota bacterium]